MKTKPVTQLLVIMYHYVKGPHVPYLSNLHGLTINELKVQLQAVQAEYEIIDYSTVMLGLNDATSLPEHCALITFDDGTADQFLHAFPVLQQLGISAVFFISTNAVHNRQLTSVHARHLITSRIGMYKFRIDFSHRYENLTDGNIIGDQDIFEAARRAYRWDEPETAQFKYLINFGISANIRNEILKGMFEKYVGDWDEWGDILYLSWTQLNEMQSENMHIGGHSHNHEALSLLPGEDLKNDFQNCFSLLSNNMHLTDIPFSYPFGKAEHFSEQVIEGLVESGFTSAYTNIQGRNKLPIESHNSRYRMMRVDPKDLNHYLTMSQ